MGQATHCVTAIRHMREPASTSRDTHDPTYYLGTVPRQQHSYPPSLQPLRPADWRDTIGSVKRRTAVAPSRQGSPRPCWSLDCQRERQRERGAKVASQPRQIRPTTSTPLVLGCRRAPGSTHGERPRQVGATAIACCEECCSSCTIARQPNAQSTYGPYRTMLSLAKDHRSHHRHLLRSLCPPSPALLSRWTAESERVRLAVLPPRPWKH